MPIYKGEADGSLIAHFGYGDILISKARSAEKSYEDEICLIQDDRSNPVGSFCDPERWAQNFAGKNSQELSVPVRMVFESVESLDALVATLAELRAEIALASGGES